MYKKKKIVIQVQILREKLHLFQTISWKLPLIEVYRNFYMYFAINRVAITDFYSFKALFFFTGHCRSSRNLLIHSLAVSLVTSLSHYDVQVLDKFYRLGGINLLMAMITSRDNSGK